jgi:hypothetical protein
MGRPHTKKRSRNIVRRRKINPETMQFLEEQRDSFQEKFGREPGPDDPLFFDPDADTPVPFDVKQVSDEIIEAMASVGVDPAIIYAFHRTGFLVTEDNLDFLSPDELAEWQAAIEEYNEKVKGKPS